MVYVITYYYPKFSGTIWLNSNCCWDMMSYYIPLKTVVCNYIYTLISDNILKVKGGQLQGSF